MAVLLCSVDLLQLEYFLAIARHEHVGRAAAELRVAQPSVSRSLARLEKEVGAPLFDRVGRGVRLNALGRILAEHGTEATSQLAAARSRIGDALSARPSGELTVASETLLTIAPLVARFRAQHPDVHLTLLQSDGPEMTHQLTDRSVDVCIASQSLNGAGIRSRVLRRERVYATVAPDHRLADRRRVTVEQLADEPFVITRRGHWQRELLEQLYPDGAARIAAETNEPGALPPLVAAGIGITLFPAVARRSDATGDVRYLPISDPRCERTLRFVRRGDRYVSSALTAFENAAVSALRGGRASSAGPLV